MVKTLKVKVPNRTAGTVVLKSFSDPSVIAWGKTGNSAIKKASSTGRFEGVLMSVPRAGRSYVY